MELEKKSLTKKKKIIWTIELMVALGVYWVHFDRTDFCRKNEPHIVLHVWMCIHASCFVCCESVAIGQESVQQEQWTCKQKSKQWMQFCDVRMKELVFLIQIVFGTTNGSVQLSVSQCMQESTQSYCIDVAEPSCVPQTGCVKKWVMKLIQASNAQHFQGSIVL